ncbi:MAG: hypothetical protein U0168_04165 [Nannocystaceae bacterium]
MRSRHDSLASAMVPPSQAASTWAIHRCAASSKPRETRPASSGPSGASRACNAWAWAGFQSASMARARSRQVVGAAPGRGSTKPITATAAAIAAALRQGLAAAR